MEIRSSAKVQILFHDCLLPSSAQLASETRFRVTFIV